MKKPLIIVVIVLAAVIAWPVYRWVARPAAEVFVVQRGTAISAVYGTVKVQPALRANVRIRTSGSIRFAKPNGKDPIAGGMEVKEGQLLGLIENTELDRELTKTEADLKAGEERLRLGPPTLQPLKTAEAGLARLEKLAALQNAPASDVERARNEVQALRERVKAEQLELDRVVTGLREQAGGLRDRKARSEIKSPIDGVLTGINLVEGEFMGENGSPFEVSSKSVYLEGQVNEEDVGVLAPPMKAVVRLYSYPQQEFAATLTQVLSGGDNQRYTVTLNFDKAPANLMTGMTGEMNIVTGQREQALIIPSRALMADHVFVVQGGVIKPRAVKIGLHSLESTEIVEGLKEGEQVVVADQDLYHPGQWVRPMAVNL